MKAYINGMGNISPQKTWGEEMLLAHPLSYANNKLTCVEPDYVSYIDAKQIRRMSRIIKMGVAAASMALREANVIIPDGIVTGTGYGCLDDTGVFLTKLIGNKEEALSPTPFIQSTHNTIGSQIALLLQCQSYNQTYTQRSLSFESALLDCFLQISEKKEKHLLVGGVDETTATSHTILNRFGLFRRQSGNSLELFKGGAKGTLNGEGACFFVLSGEKGTNALATIEAVTLLYKPEVADLRKAIDDVISRTKPGTIDLVLSGKSGDQRSDQLIEKLVPELFPAAAIGLFKHLCGEYPVASAFACWLGASMLKKQTIPDIVMEKRTGNSLENILIFNQYFGSHYSLILLKAC
jgi:3-oxoacyl-[acyl-carrier-protein] synthase II